MPLFKRDIVRFFLNGLRGTIGWLLVGRVNKTTGRALLIKGGGDDLNSLAGEVERLHKGGFGRVPAGTQSTNRGLTNLQKV